MYQLMTKKSRQDARAAWIGGRKTEIYKDREILTYEKDCNGVKRYILTVWRGTAGNPYINYLCRTAEQAQSYIIQEKKRADEHERYYQEHPKINGVQTQSAKTAQLIKKILKKDFPLVKFSVTSDNFANGNSVDISWIDGVPEKDVVGFARQFEAGSFDGMTDCYNYDNGANHPQAKYVHCQRRISPEKQAIIQKQLAELMSIENMDYTVIPKGYMVNIRGYAFDAPLSALVYQISKDFDFTKGLTGVRKQNRDGVEVSNMFELY